MLIVVLVRGSIKDGPTHREADREVDVRSVDQLESVQVAILDGASFG